MCVDKKDLKCKYEGCENPVKYSSLLICNAHYQWEKKGKPEPGYKVINCEVCKKEIKPKAGNQRFCKECQYQRRLMKNCKRRIVQKVNKICERCGIEFSTSRFFQIFCSKRCSSESKGLRDVNYYWRITKIKDNHLGRRESYPQQYVFDIIKEEFSNLEWKYDVRSIIRNPITKHMLELDIWCEEKKVAIEFDGEQHSAPKYGESVFEITKRNDKIKEEMCVEKNIKLLRISYKDDWKNKEWVIGKVGELINDNY